MRPDWRIIEETDMDLLKDDAIMQLLDRSRELGAVGIEMEALNGLGRVRYFKGDMASAEALFENGLFLAHREEDAISISLALNCLANTVADAHMAYDKTVSLLADSLKISRAAEDHYGEARALINLGSVAQERNELEEAKKLFLHIPRSHNP